MESNSILESFERLKAPAFQAISEGWRTLIERASPDFYFMKNRTKANYLNDAIVQAAIRIMKDQNVKHQLVDETDYFYMNDAPIVFRFKKMNNHRKPSNILTERQRKYYNQEDSQVGLFVGYEVDQYWAEIVNTSVICPQGLGLNSWHEDFKAENSQLVLFTRDEFIDNDELPYRIKGDEDESKPKDGESSSQG